MCDVATAGVDHAVGFPSLGGEVPATGRAHLSPAPATDAEDEGEHGGEEQDGEDDEDDDEEEEGDDSTDEAGRLRTRGSKRKRGTRNNRRNNNPAAMQGRFSGRLGTKDDERKLAEECKLIGRGWEGQGACLRACAALPIPLTPLYTHHQATHTPRTHLASRSSVTDCAPRPAAAYLGGDSSGKNCLQTLAKLVRAIASGEVRCHLAAREGEIADLKARLADIGATPAGTHVVQLQEEVARMRSEGVGAARRIGLLEAALAASEARVEELEGALKVQHASHPEAQHAALLRHGSGMSGVVQQLSGGGAGGLQGAIGGGNPATLALAPATAGAIALAPATMTLQQPLPPVLEAVPCGAAAMMQLGALQQVQAMGMDGTGMPVPVPAPGVATGMAAVQHGGLAVAVTTPSTEELGADGEKQQNTPTQVCVWGGAVGCYQSMPSSPAWASSCTITLALATTPPPTSPRARALSLAGRGRRCHGRWRRCHLPY